MPLSTNINLLPSSISKQRIVQVHKLFSSAAFNLFQIDLGTTPNMAPPSNLKSPVSMLYNFISILLFKANNYWHIIHDHHVIILLELIPAALLHSWSFAYATLNKAI